MFKKNKEPWNKPFPEKIAVRVSKVPTADLVLWIDQAISETNRSLSSYQRSGDKIHLDDMLVGGEAINALTSELHKRSVL